MKRLTTVLTLFVLFTTFTSFDFFKPSEKDLVGFWEVDEYLKENKSQPIEDLNISLQCSVEGNIGKFSGINGKNLFSGLYEIKSKKAIALKGLMTTKYDETPVSKSFIESFQNASEFKLENNRLLLIDSKSNAVIIFNKND